MASGDEGSRTPVQSGLSIGVYTFISSLSPEGILPRQTAMSKGLNSACGIVFSSQAVAVSSCDQPSFAVRLLRTLLAWLPLNRWLLTQPYEVECCQLRLRSVIYEADDHPRRATQGLEPSVDAISSPVKEYYPAKSRLSNVILLTWNPQAIPLVRVRVSEEVLNTLPATGLDDLRTVPIRETSVELSQLGVVFRCLLVFYESVEAIEFHLFPTAISINTIYTCSRVFFAHCPINTS